MIIYEPASIFHNGILMNVVHGVLKCVKLYHSNLVSIMAYIARVSLPQMSQTKPYVNKKYLERVNGQEENPFTAYVPGQKYVRIPAFLLESGVALADFPVAYQTWGKLNDTRDNVMVICHALTGNADVADWWGPLIGPGRAFDTTRFFIFCANCLGSPYGSASPVILNPDTGKRYGPEFPLVTIRDDVQIQKLILDDLGVKSVATAIGGSLGGMLVLEWAFFGKEYVRTIVPLATSARHSAWCISWGEAQRQSIYSDPKYQDGYYGYSDPPVAGLGAARMSALLTYRSRDSFESRFGRTVPNQTASHLQSASTLSEEHWAHHNEGFKNAKRYSSTKLAEPSTPPADPMASSTGSIDGSTRRHPKHFSAQSYLRYQGDKFVKRFDANCYIALTRKMDTHDISRGRGDNVEVALASITQPALVLGIESDGLFTFAEQREIAWSLSNATLDKIDSPEGHDSFLIEFAQVNAHITNFLQRVLPEIMSKTGAPIEEDVIHAPRKPSTVGEVEDSGITAW